MADGADHASDLSDLFLKHSLSQSRQTKPRLPFKGRCYNCEETVAAQTHFCDADCRTDWEMRTRNQ